MATIFSHPAVAVALFPWSESLSEKPCAMIFVGALLTIIPDLDVIAFRFGIPYNHMFGHRGFSHSMIFAVIISGIAAWGISRYSRVEIQYIWLYFLLCALSHGFIDAFTNGGHGIAFFAPFSGERYFFFFQPIDVSPIGFRRFLSGRGMTAIRSELIWVWLPCAIILIAGKVFRYVTSKSW